MLNNRTMWLIATSTILFLGAAFITLRAAERASQAAIAPAGGTITVPPVTPRTTAAPGTIGAPGVTVPSEAPSKHPPPAAPEESATIIDDPATAPDPAQSADNNVSFPTDI